MGVHHFVVQLGPDHILRMATSSRALVFLYVGPDQMLPLTSALGAIVGVLLMFWHRVVALVRKAWRLLLQTVYSSPGPIGTVICSRPGLQLGGATSPLKVSQAWQRLLDEFAGDASKPALERLLAIFDALERSIRNPGFYGCPFIKTLAEFGPERKEAQVQERLDTHFQGMEEVVARLLKEIRPKDSKKLIAPLMSLICGTIVVAQATGKMDIANRNRELVKALLSD